MKSRMLFAVSVLASLLVPFTVDAQSSCTLATLTGTYGFSATGYNPINTKTRSSAPQSPASEVGLVTFDGAGNFSTSFIDVTNGGGTSFTDTGTYTVNSDCTGSFHLEGLDIHLQGVIVGGGTEVLATVTDPGLIRTDDLKKQ
jgi:hypothetical protein